MKKILSFLLIILLFGAVACNDPLLGKYNAAMELLKKGEFEDASTEFSALGEYNDSIEKTKLSKYYLAIDSANQLEFSKALNLFEELGDYADSKEKLSEVFLMATNKYVNGNYSAQNYKEFLNKCEEIEVLDTKENYKELYYLLASDFFSEKNYETAKTIAVNITDFENAEALYNEAKYQSAIIESNDGKLKNALTIFESLGKEKYRNSTSHAKGIREAILCTYFYGDITADNGQKANTVMYFVKIGNTVGGCVIAKDGISNKVLYSMEISALVAWDGYLMAKSGSINYKTCDEYIYQTGNKYTIKFNNGVLNGMEFETHPYEDKVPSYKINESINFTVNSAKTQNIKNKYSNINSSVKPTKELEEQYNLYSKNKTTGLYNNNQNTSSTINNTSQNVVGASNNNQNSPTTITSSTPKGSTNNITISTVTTPVTNTHTHSFSKATCTKPATCSCGATSGTASGHNWKPANCTAAKTCKVCGVTQGKKAEHSYSDTDRKCTMCGGVNPKPPEWWYFDVNYVPKTLKYDGYTLNILDYAYANLDKYNSGEAVFQVKASVTGVTSFENQECPFKKIVLKFYDANGNLINEDTKIKNGDSYVGERVTFRCTIPKLTKKIEIYYKADRP